MAVFQRRSWLIIYRLQFLRCTLRVNAGLWPLQKSKKAFTPHSCCAVQKLAVVSPVWCHKGALVRYDQFVYSELCSGPLSSLLFFVIIFCFIPSLLLRFFFIPSKNMWYVPQSICFLAGGSKQMAKHKVLGGSRALLGWVSMFQWGRRWKKEDVNGRDGTLKASGLLFQSEPPPPKKNCLIAWSNDELHID